MNLKGQGALEYLLLVGGAVLVAAVVLTLVTSISTTGQESASKRTIDTLCSPIPENRCGVGSAAPIDPNGDETGGAGLCTWNTALSQCIAS